MSMGIYIKGQNLPKDGEHYLIQINSDGTIYDAVGQRLAGIAVELPPHGRTIDADVLYALLKKERDRIAKGYGDDDPFARCLTIYAMSMVLSAPTIIGAEAEK